MNFIKSQFRRSAVRRLLIAAAVLIAGPVQAKPAWMLMMSGHPLTNANPHPPTTREFPSMEACERTAEYITAIRNSRTSGIGIKGAWKMNYKSQGTEPGVSMLCVPDTEEMADIQKELLEKKLFKDVNESSK